MFWKNELIYQNKTNMFVHSKFDFYRLKSSWTKSAFSQFTSRLLMSKVSQFECIDIRVYWFDRCNSICHDTKTTISLFLCFLKYVGSISVYTYSTAKLLERIKTFLKILSRCTNQELLSYYYIVSHLCSYALRQYFSANGTVNWLSYWTISSSYNNWLQ